MLQRFSRFPLPYVVAMLLLFVVANVLAAEEPPAVVTSYREVVKQVLPAVVSIETNVPPVARLERKEDGRFPDDLFDHLPKEFRKYFERFPGIPEFKDFKWDAPELERFDKAPTAPRHGLGSGVIVDKSGIVLTNHHVVASAKKVRVRLYDGREFDSVEILSDPKTDLAIVRIDAKEPLPYLKLADSDKAEIGDKVLAIGAPFGLIGSVTHGIISGKGRSMGHHMYEDYIQTDAAINPGNSGGPLVNLKGEVVGINSAIRTRTGTFSGVGLAIPSNLARNIMTKLLKHGEVRRAFLGVNIRDLDADVAERFNIEAGVLVAEVVKGSPAERSGLKAGDIITAVDGNAVSTAHELQHLIGNMEPGKTVELALVRDGKKTHLKVKLGEQAKEFGISKATPKPAPKAKVSFNKIGVALTDVTPELARKFGFKDGPGGAIITEVKAGSLADLSDLRPGMLVTMVDDKTVSSAAEAEEAINKASLEKGILIRFRSADAGVGYVIIKSKE
ncbi:MAG: serine protease MucD [Gemmatales bacterium]|nr:MAG: serine protease MucD [Gemmatales bacterium]